MATKIDTVVDVLVKFTKLDKPDKMYILGYLSAVETRQEREAKKKSHRKGE